MHTNEKNDDSTPPSSCKNVTTSVYSHSAEKESSSNKRKATKLLNIKSSSLNILCKICGDKSSGFHYGVHACEGCKGFFRRTVRMKLEYDVCDQMCKVDLKNRNRCQYCRYKKCVDQGMSHDAIRFGRMPRVEKERIIADTVDLANSSAVGSTADPDKNVRIFCLIESLSASFLKHCSMTKDKVNHVWMGRKALGDEAKSLRHLGDVMKTYPQINEEMRNIASSSVHDRKERNSDGNAGSSSSMEEASGNLSMSTDYDSKDASTPTSSSDLIEVAKGNPMSASNVNFLTSSLPDLKLSASNGMLNRQEIVTGNHQSSTNYFPAPGHPSTGFPGIPFHFTGPEAKNFIAASKLGSIVPGAALESNVKQFPSFPGDSRKHVDKGEKNASNMSGKQLLRQRLAQVLYLRMQKRLVIGISELCEFAKQIPQFLNLDITDQVVLLKYGSYEAVFVMMGSLVFDKGILLPLTNLYVSFEFIEELEVAGDVMRSKLKFAEKIAALQLNDVELALFVAVILVSPDRPGLIESSKVETIQDEILASLKVQLSLCHPNKPRLFGQLLLLLTELRQLVAEHVVMVERLNKIQEIAPPLIQEILTGFE